MNSTEKYIKEHEYIFSLPRIKLTYPKKRKIVGWSLTGLLKLYIHSLLSTLKNYPLEVWRIRSYLAKTIQLKQCKKGKVALVIGNGPSQGYLSVDILNSFVKNGGETYCVNYWPSNQQLSSHVPTWMVFSDPATFKPSEKAEILVDYLKRNSSVKIAAPSSLIPEIKLHELTNETYVYIDSELMLWKNINPLYPRGYCTMTLYKALAWTVYLGYNKIGVIGMDNTYPRNIFNDKNNCLCNLETHAGEQDYIVDQSDMYENVAARLEVLAQLFHHLSYFCDKNIVNLDPYSLTDAFEKTSIDSFFEKPFFGTREG